MLGVAGENPRPPALSDNPDKDLGEIKFIKKYI